MLLQRGGEPARARRQARPAGGARAGEIDDQQQAAWRKIRDVFDEQGQRYRNLSLFPEDQPLPEDAVDSIQVRLSGEKVLRLLVVNRLLEPGSEFRLHRHWFVESGMDAPRGRGLPRRGQGPALSLSGPHPGA
ncbi:MAG: hypothetical protein KIT83_19040 [Bryobacterales bacterium]|nr:hypothetical protein [Bryobacterales bacterium]